MPSPSTSPVATRPPPWHPGQARQPGPYCTPVSSRGAVNGPVGLVNAGDATNGEVGGSEPWIVCSDGTPLTVAWITRAKVFGLSWIENARKLRPPSDSIERKITGLAASVLSAFL